MNSRSKNIVLYILSSLFLVGIVCVVVLATIDYNNRLITDINIVFKYPGDKVMLYEDDVKKSLSQELEFIKNSKVRFFNDTIIKDKIMLLKPIRSSNVSCGIKGEMFISIVQKEPMANLIIDSTLYYLMDDSCVISYHYYKGPILPSFYFENKKQEGYDNKLLSDIYVLSDFYQDSSFLKNCTDSIIIDKKNNLFIKTKYGKQKVFVGDMDNLEDKSDNLYCFYRSISDEMLDQYKVIKLNFKNQVVAVKNK